MTQAHYQAAISRLTILAVCFCAACFNGACDGTSSSSGGHRIRLVLATVAMPAKSSEYAHFQAAIDRFKKRRPDVDVDRLEISGNYYHKLTVMMAGRIAPDLMWMGAGFAEFAERGALLDVTERIAAVDTSRFLPQCLEWYRFHGKQYGIPFGIDTQFILYNRKLFDDAKLPYPRDDWDYEEFLRDARALTADLDGDGRIDRYGYSGELDPAIFGAEYLARDGSRALCNSPAMIDYLQTNLDLIHKEKIGIPGKGGAENKLDDVISLFRQGRVGMALMFTWDLPFLREKLADMDWDIVTNPKVRTRGHWASSRAIVISAETKHPDGAWQLCQEFFGEEFQRAMADTVVPSDLRIAEQWVAAHQGKPRNARALVDAVTSARIVPRVPHATELIQIWNDACDSVRDNRATPQDAMARAAGEIDRAIAKQSAANARAAR